MQSLFKRDTYRFASRKCDKAEENWEPARFCRGSLSKNRKLRVDPYDLLRTRRFFDEPWEHDGFKLKRSWSLSIVLAHDLVRKI